MSALTLVDTPSAFAPDVTDLIVCMGIDELPVPERITWSPRVGLSVLVPQGELGAWFASAGPPQPLTGTVEVLVGHTVYQWTQRVLNSPARTPIMIESTLTVTDQQIAIHEASKLSFEEVVSWFEDWATATPEQQRTLWSEMRWDCKVPTQLLPAPAEVS